MKINTPHKFNTLEDIKNWKPTFNYYGMEMVEWFEVKKTNQWVSIRSGLRHADGETKSPFNYEDVEVGNKNNTKNILTKFNNWYNGLRDNRIISK